MKQLEESKLFILAEVVEEMQKQEEFHGPLADQREALFNIEEELKGFELKINYAPDPDNLIRAAAFSCRYLSQFTDVNWGDVVKNLISHIKQSYYDYENFAVMGKGFIYYFKIVPEYTSLPSFKEVHFYNLAAECILLVSSMKMDSGRQIMNASKRVLNKLLEV